MSTAVVARNGSCLCKGLAIKPPSIRSVKRRNIYARAQNQEVYQGLYGPWTIDDNDKREVLGYRVGLTTTAAAVVFGTAAAYVPADSTLHDGLMALLDPACAISMAGLGMSLYLIHIYVDPLKKLLWAFWAAGVLGALGIMLTEDVPAAVYVAEHHEATWFVGPLFAAITGVAFKEGLCYGKWEAAALFVTVPLLLLGHLTGLMGADAERALLALFCVLITIFAARKYTQNIKDDIGDKSIFMFMKLSPEEQEAVLQQKAISTSSNDG